MKFIYKKDIYILACVTLFAAILRWLFLQRMELPSFDPWRHLALIRNLRQGAGFTLFDGQPYIWYSPVWYAICASVPDWIKVLWISSLLSTLSTVLMYLFLRSPFMGLDLRASTAGALMAASFGPLINFTCHYGSEAFALFMTLTALVLCAHFLRPWSTFLGGLFLGVAMISRMNFAFLFLLFPPMLQKPSRAFFFLSGLAAPLSSSYWWNSRSIKNHAYLFTWDGIATPSAGYAFLSTLVVQMHATVQEGIRALHQMIIPVPEWTSHWELSLFMGIGLICVALGKRWSLFLSALVPFVYFMLLDHSLSSNFFRIYLPLFPVFFIAVSLAAKRLFQAGNGRSTLAGWILVILVMGAGVKYLRPDAMYPLEEVTPPPEALTADAYMVNSGFYQPESLIYRFPDKQFIGLPLHPASFEDFYKNYYGQYKFILWHEFSVQDELLKYLLQSGKFTIIRAFSNKAGRKYLLLEASKIEPEAKP